jgi:hypothetical protein
MRPRTLIRITGPRLRLALLFIVLRSATAVWVLIDRRPPEWDDANHLERAVDCYRRLRIVSDSGVREILEASCLYPPVVTCAAGALYLMFPRSPHRAAGDVGFPGRGHGLPIWPRAPPRRRRDGALVRVLLRDRSVRRLLAHLALPWDGPRLFGLPMQIFSRSFSQAAEQQNPEP